MANTWIEAYVKCPFFRYTEKRQIFCTGCIPDTTAAHTFSNDGDKDVQLKEFCCDSYKRCELYRAIIESREW